jgi:tetratricopeptide (TPR) repeat protein
VLRELIREIQRKPPGVRDGLIAFAITAPAGSLAWLVVSKISTSVHRNLSDAASSAIGFGVVAFVALAWLFREPIRRASGKYKPKGDCLAVYIAQFEGDINSRVLQQRIEATIRADFGNTIDIIYTELPPLPPQSENAETEAAEVSAKARALLAESGGDIAIWGKLLDVRQEACPVHFVLPNESGSTSNSFRFNGEKLETAFSAELGSVIAARAAAYADATVEKAGGDYSADAFAAIAQRLGPIVDQIPDCIPVGDRSRLLRAFGRIHAAIQSQSGENAPLDVAIQSYKRALSFLQPDHHPFDWARLKTDLGESLKDLGWRQFGVEKLTEAVGVLREALEVPEFSRNPAERAVAERALSEALNELGRREGKVETIREGIAAANRAIGLLDPKESPQQWAIAQGALGMGLYQLGRLDEGTEHLQASVAAFESELTELTRLGRHLDCGIAKHNMANAFLKWGQKAGSPEKIRRAVDEYRAALDVLKAFPLEWAHAQVNLGNALTELSTWEDTEERLREGIAAYELALNTELTRARDAHWWASTQFNCGVSLVRLGELQTDSIAFQRAETTFRQSLAVWTSGPEHDQAIEALAHVHLRLKERGDRGVQ